MNERKIAKQGAKDIVRTLVKRCEDTVRTMSGHYLEIVEGTSFQKVTRAPYKHILRLLCSF